ncbi:unnamed protein product [Urochloa humidicola]
MVKGFDHSGLAPSPSRIHQSFLSRGDLAAAAQRLFWQRASNRQDGAGLPPLLLVRRLSALATIVPPLGADRRRSSWPLLSLPSTQKQHQL